MDIQGVNLSSFIMAAIMTIPILFFYSSRTEKNRVVTITKPLMITQARKTPAYYLFQHAKKIETTEPAFAVAGTTYLNAEVGNVNIQQVVIAEMTLKQQEIGTPADFGFRLAQAATLGSENVYDPDAIAQQIIETKTPAIQPMSSPLKKWATVKGKFELKDGVGIVDHIVEIKRVEEGQVRELGQVDLKQGMYSIDIESPQGTLIAQIKDKNGTLIGEDQKKIFNLARQGSYFEGPYIQVGKPAELGVPIQSSSAPTGAGSGSGNAFGSGAAAAKPIAQNGRGRAQPTRDSFTGVVASLFSSQHKLEKPADHFKNISQSSSSIAMIEDSKEIYSNIITIRQTGDEIETPLFKRMWVSGALEYISDQMKLEFKSKSAPILIGRILIDNKPAAGVKVQIENQMGINPVYLDSFMIPNSKQEETSENGYFMFVGLEPDNYSVMAFKNNKIVGHQMFIGEENAIAYQNIEATTATRSILVRSFDAFTGQAVDADVVIPDSDDIFTAENGVGSFRTQNAAGLSNFIVRPKGQYMAINFVQDSRLDHVHVPQINESWIQSIQTRKEINDQPNSGTIVGFVPDMEYEVFLVVPDFDTQNIVYFDSQGEISEQPTKGGGFIMYNVPAGAREVVVQEKESERIYSQVQFVKLSQTSVSRFSE